MGNSWSFARGPPLPSPEAAQIIPVTVPVSISPSIEPVSTRHVRINQAVCYGCNTILRDRGSCKCGNVEIYGEPNELRRNVRNHTLYSDCSLIEYVRT